MRHEPSSTDRAETPAPNQPAAPGVSPTPIAPATAGDPVPTNAVSGATSAPATASLPIKPAGPKAEAQLPDIVLGGAQPFNAERSPLIRFIKLCTLLLKFSVAVVILGFMLFYYLSISNPAIAAKMSSKAGLTPFKTVNQILAMPAQVMGKTKDVVASNDERVADLDNVITLSEGKDPKTRPQGSVYTPPTDSAPEPAFAAAGETKAPTSAIGQMFALPGQVLNQTKAVVEKNNARAGTLDGVIANPEGMAKTPADKAGRTATPGAPKKPAPPVKTSVSAEDTDKMAQSLIDFSLAQSAADQAAGIIPAPIVSSLKPAVVAPSEATPAASVHSPKRLQLGGGITITSPSPNGGIEASEAFLTWVVNVRISGVFPGSPARVMINDRLTRTGDPAQIRLGISFDGLDVEQRSIFFRDKNGATVSRSY